MSGGRVRKEWDNTKLGKVITLQRGYDLPYRVRANGDFPVVTSTGITDTHSEYREQAPGVVTGRYGTIGEVFYIDKDYWPHNTTLFVRDFHGNDPLFVAYLLTTIDFQSHSGKSGVPGVNRNDLHALEVSIPSSVNEQEAIASTLSDIDNLIASLDRLIAKKRDLKQATMQQLPTGKKRLPGFQSDWQSKQIGSLAPLQRGFDLPNSQLEKGPFPVVYSNGILNHHVAYQANGPGVVTGRSGTIGKVTFVTDNYWPHNTALWVTSFKGNDPKFVFYLYTYIGFERFATGSGVPTLNRNDVHSFECFVPDHEEQTAIAQVLTDMDTELTTLQTRRAKTQALKQAMMQELLTGRTRLV